MPYVYLVLLAGAVYVINRSLPQNWKFTKRDDEAPHEGMLYKGVQDEPLQFN